MDSLHTNNLNISDSLLWDLWLSRQYLPALAVADKINIFECINTGKYEVNEIANLLKMEKRGIEALIFFLISIKLLSYENKKVSLTKTAITYLLPSSTYYWGYAFAKTQDTEDYKKILLAIARSPGIPIFGNESITNMWKRGNVDPILAETFNLKSPKDLS
ncbi:MAG: hypothetical protein KBD37_09290 [Burkholderiales bacterium]|nr:hypothetical protein [Burkholderiales bacterium]